MSNIQERSIVVRNFDQEKTTEKLLKELCMQAGPVRKVVLRPDHAFVEYDHFESVGYAKALLDGVELFGRPLAIDPKLRLSEHFKYIKALENFIAHEKHRRAIERQRQNQIHYQMRYPMHMFGQNQFYQPPPQIQNYNQPSNLQYNPPPHPPPGGSLGS